MTRTLKNAMIAAMISMCGGCSDPTYDTSTPQAALDSMYQSILDEHPAFIGKVIHIQPRDITYDDGVTEASAINEVIDKAGQMLDQLFRVAGKLRERFPDALAAESALATGQRSQSDIDAISRFLTDPFGLMDQQRQRVSVEDLGDGTAALLIDDKPAFGVGIQMREIDGLWKIDVPIELLQAYRPNTRQEWRVIANMMLAVENSLTAFEAELDRDEFRDLQQASARAGRLLGERAFVQAMIYRQMKSQQGT